MARPEGNATEQPTPQRLLRARQRGQVAVSRDLSGGLAFAALVALFAGAAPVGLARLLGLFERALGNSATTMTGTSGLGAAATAALQVAAPLLFVPLGVAWGVAVLVGVVQTGGLFAWQGIAPDLGRLSPAAGLKRLLGGRTLVEIGIGLWKAAVVLLVAAFSLGTAARALPRLAGATPLGVLTALGVLAERLTSQVALALVGLGMVDWLLARRRHRRALMMTRDEVRREYKESEGDPRHRAERQRLHREVGEQRMIEDVRRADFVVVNPDHIAVAVKYDRDSDAAPVVIAKGERLLAERIKQVARESGVPIYRDLTLAQSLHALPEGEEIPEALYEAVAELLRVLWEIDHPAPLATASGSSHPRPGSAPQPPEGGDGGDGGDVGEVGLPSASWKRV